MRSILLAAAALLLAPALHAQTGVMSVGARILPAQARVVEPAAGSVRMERGAGGGMRLSLPVTLSPGARPIVSTEQVAGGPACTLVPERGDAANWGARVRCTVPPGTAPGATLPVRLLLTPNT